MIWLSVLLLLAAMLGLTLLLRYAVTRAGQVVGKSTYERHTAAEEILSSGGVPGSWRGGHLRPPYPPEAGRGFVRRLDELIRHFERAPVFDSEPTRQLLLEDLRAARARWEKGEWEVSETEPPGVSPPS